MKLKCKWNEKMSFTAEANGHQVSMDAKSPVGSDSAMNARSFLLATVLFKITSTPLSSTETGKDVRYQVM